MSGADFGLEDDWLELGDRAYYMGGSNQRVSLWSVETVDMGNGDVHYTVHYGTKPMESFDDEQKARAFVEATSVIAAA